MRHYIVTLYNYEDLEGFYDDMETPGGDLYIPNRKVELVARRPISRNTHYWLTDEEAQLVAKDKRVMSVELDISEIGAEFVPTWSQTGNFDKGNTLTSTDKNWGLYRCISGSPLSNWGTNGSFTETTQTISTKESGKNVDVVIVDSHLNVNHPEFAVNADGTGGSRANQLNWFQYSSDLGYSTTGSYSYSTITTTHGMHVAGTACGNTQGWARDANIYNIEFNSSAISGYNSSVSWGNALWDYIRLFHRKKSINPATNKRNPTVTNHSYGIQLPTPLWINDVWTNYKDELGDATGNSTARFHTISQITYRGTTTSYTSPSVYNSASVATLDAKVNSLRERGIPVVIEDFGLGGYNAFFGYVYGVPINSNAITQDILDALKDGVIAISAAGNSSFNCDIFGGVDYDNLITFKDGANSNNNISLNPHQGSSPSSCPGTISVGNIGTKTQEYKSTSSNYGPRIDIWAPGTNIISSLYSNTATSQLSQNEINGYSPIADPRNSNFFLGKATGTSMASPQVCGLIACISENWSRATQIDAFRYLMEFSKYNQVGDTGGNYSDFESISASGQSINNRFLYYDSPRESSGFMSFKSATYSQRIIPTNLAQLAQTALGLSTTPTQPLKYPRKNTLVFKNS